MVMEKSFERTKRSVDARTTQEVLKREWGGDDHGDKRVKGAVEGPWEKDCHTLKDKDCHERRSTAHWALNFFIFSGCWVNLELELELHAFRFQHAAASRLVGPEQCSMRQ
jgi:hypothetical protein